MLAADTNRVIKAVREALEASKNSVESRVIAVASEANVDRTALLRIVSAIRVAADEASSAAVANVESALRRVSSDARKGR